MGSYQTLERNHYLSTQVGLVKEWRAQDTVAFSQLVDFTEIEAERERRASQGFTKPSYTAFVIDSIARALPDHPKMNRIVSRGLRGYHWSQFKQIDISVAVELVEDDLDIAYASIIRDANLLGLDGITETLRKLVSAPADNPQLKTLRRFPAALTALLARATGLHPELWVRFRGGSCAVTSPAKYGVENISVKSCWPVQFGFGKVDARPIVVEGRCVARRSAVLSMSWHRELTTGAVAARFFAQIVEQLEQSRMCAEDSRRAAEVIAQ